MDVLSLTGVHKRYGPTTALAGVDIAVARGEVVALLGPNRAGQPAVVDLPLGLAGPRAGRAGVRGAPPGSRRHRVGAMLQSAGLPDQVTVAELVGLVGRAYPRPLPVREVLERTALADRARRTVTALSGGE